MSATQDQSGDAAVSDLGDVLAYIAGEVLDTLEAVAARAQADLLSVRTPSPNALVNPDGFNSPQALRNLRAVGADAQQDLLVLADEPIVARVRYIDDQNREQILYICRRGVPTAPPPGVRLASYRSALGRLAALRPGEDVELQLPGREGWYEVQERALLRPVRREGAWDSRDTLHESTGSAQRTIRSLRALLLREEAFDLASFLAEGGADENIVEGVKRRVLTRVSLRDQPVLDRFQDEIFRLPLGRRLVLLGAPGSGKTTTLIRRLGQKLDVLALDDDERRQIARTPAGEAGHARSWIMFTPTTLLREYLDRAFGREGVPASDQTIRTWDDHRRGLARSRFPILRTGSGRAGFTWDAESPLRPGVEARLPELFDAFECWRKEAFWRRLAERAGVLADTEGGAAAPLGRRLAAIAEAAVEGQAPTAFLATADQEAVIRGVLDAEARRLRDRTEAVLTRLANVDRAFAQALTTFVAGLGREPVDADPEEDELSEEDEDDEPLLATDTARHRAVVAFRKAVIAQARAESLRRTVPPASRNGRLLAWLGERSAPAEMRPALARSAAVRAAARAFLNPLRSYLNGPAAAYRRFRRVERAEGRWFAPASARQGLISDLEMDVVLLSSLRGARELMDDGRVLRRLGETFFAPLQTLRTEVLRNQIMVDEATDFSPIQLACMAALSDPELGSFFACGDFGQRITLWGARGNEDLAWAAPNVEARTIGKAYRQSGRLLAFAADLAGLSGLGVEAEPVGATTDEPGPVLGLGLGTVIQQADWLAERISELLNRVGASGELPTIAVLVAEEAAVTPLADALDAALRPVSVRARACVRGEVVGQDSDVRVFDVQHIKGLEFEAVFFVRLDRLASLQPALFDKYLFVGATRAATFLGLTCEGARLLPALAPLEAQFVSDWPDES